MPIETSCDGCGQTLRVQDEHAGKLARCPTCNSIYRVPVPDGLESVVERRAESPSTQQPSDADPLAPIPFDDEPLEGGPSVSQSGESTSGETAANQWSSAEHSAASANVSAPLTSPAESTGHAGASSDTAQRRVDEDLVPTAYPVNGSHSSGRESVQSSPESQGAAHSRWLMRTPEGAEYGPVPHHELLVWVHEGRVSADCDLREDGGAWFPADRMFPQLRPEPRSTSYPATSFVAPSPQPARARHVQQRRLPSDRGAIVLALGIMGWIIICPFVSMAAWIMGASDLRQMREGRMMRSNMGMTQVGRTLGMLHVVLTALFIFFLFLMNA